MDIASLLGETHTPFVEIALRLGASVVLALAIGLERELRRKTAGLRTHMLVALGSATFAVLTIELAHDAAWLTENARLDPLRVVQAIITGVAFLGAGAIIQAGGTVRGLTTGASIWLAGSIGLACGIGSFGIALLLVVLSLVILSLFRLLEQWMETRAPSKEGGAEE